jgi:hypothetical protein
VFSGHAFTHNVGFLFGALILQWHDVRGRAAKEAAAYTTLKPYRKSKNLLVALMLGLPALSLVLLVYLGVEVTIESIVSMLIHLLLAVFVYLNHRWAMVAYGCLFVGNWFAALAGGASFTTLNLALIVIVVLVTNISVRVATTLKSDVG